MKLILQPDRRQLRQFAWASLLLLPAIAAFLAWKYGLPTTWVMVLVGLGMLIAVVELVLVDVLPAVAGAWLEKLIPRAIFQLLTLVSYPIGFVLSHVLIAIIYYLVITPIALVFRLMGRDVIGRRIDRSATSYWTERRSVRPASSYFKLY